MMFMPPGVDPDDHITVINMEDGTRLSGEDAPKRVDPADWLIHNTNYLPEIAIIILHQQLLIAIANSIQMVVLRNLIENYFSA